MQKCRNIKMLLYYINIIHKPFTNTFWESEKNAVLRFGTSRQGYLLNLFENCAKTNSLIYLEFYIVILNWRQLFYYSLQF